jgi:HEAT repeat protein
VKNLASAMIVHMRRRKKQSEGRATQASATKVPLTTDPGATARLLDLFWAQTDKNDVWETALALERLGDSGAVPALVTALDDENLDRRHAAARALGWIPKAGSRAAKALMRVLPDHAQPQPVRETAAESLAYLHYAPSIPVLISVLDESDVRMRFWAAFALGSIGQWQTQTRPARGADRRIIEALERRLSDEAVPPGNWWSVAREALAMLGELDPKYGDELNRETQRVLNDPSSSPEDLRWAGNYC